MACNCQHSNAPTSNNEEERSSLRIKVMWRTTSTSIPCLRFFYVTTAQRATEPARHHRDFRCSLVRLHCTDQRSPCSVKYWLQHLIKYASYIERLCRQAISFLSIGVRYTFRVGITVARHSVCYFVPTTRIAINALLAENRYNRAYFWAKADKSLQSHSSIAVAMHAVSVCQSFSPVHC